MIRAEATFRLDETIGARARAHVTTDFRPEPRLALWVPAEMHEEYEDLPGNVRPVFGPRSEGAARYAGFRRFSVSTDESDARVSEPPSR